MTTSKWHISPDGTPRKCNPVKTGVCAYGGDTPHFTNEVDARTAYEAFQKNSFSSIVLNKNAVKTEESFTFLGADFDSRAYILVSGSWLSNDTVSITSDGYHYTLKSYNNTFYWETLKKMTDGWEGSAIKTADPLQGTSAQEAKDKLEKVLLENASKEVQKWHRNPNLTKKALWEHVQDQKIRWDCINGAGNLDYSKLLEKVGDFKSKSQAHHFGELEESIKRVNTIKLNPLRRGFRIVSEQNEEMQLMLHLDALNLVKYDSSDGVISFDKVLKDESELRSFLAITKLTALLRD